MKSRRRYIFDAIRIAMRLHTLMNSLEYITCSFFCSKRFVDWTVSCEMSLPATVSHLLNFPSAFLVMDSAGWKQCAPSRILCLYLCQSPLSLQVDVSKKQGYTTLKWQTGRACCWRCAPCTSKPFSRSFLSTILIYILPTDLWTIPALYQARVI